MYFSGSTTWARASLRRYVGILWGPIDLLLVKPVMSFPTSERERERGGGGGGGGEGGERHTDRHTER